MESVEGDLHLCLDLRARFLSAAKSVKPQSNLFRIHDCQKSGDAYPEVDFFYAISMLNLKTYFVIGTLAVICSQFLAGRANGAAAYIIVDDHTGRILEARDASDKLQIASLTKMTTAIVVLDWAEKNRADLSQLAMVPTEALAQGSANPVGFQAGDSLTLRDLIYASLLQSDNVAAYTLAAHVGRALSAVTPPKVRETGSVGVFVAQMNALARSLGMERTLYLNPHGLDSDKTLPYSTAADQARLARYAMRDAGFRFYVSQKQREITIRRGDSSFKYLLENTNSLLGSDHIDGIKTGRTRRAGDCLALSAGQRPLTRQQGDTVLVTPRRITVILLGSTNRFSEGAALMQRGWRLFEQHLQANTPLDPKNTL